MKKIILSLVIVILMESTAFAGRPAPAIFKHIGNDIKYTVAGWPMLLFTIGTFATPMLSQADTLISQHFNNNSRLGKFDNVLNYAGSAYIVDPSSVIVYGVGKLIHNEKVALTGETLFEALLLTEGVAGGMKLAFQRQRPNQGNYGFPSGHAARTFCLATVLEVMHGPMLGVPAYLFAGAVGFSRIDSNVHYLSDVFYGAVIGTTIGWGTANFHNKLMNDRYAILPMTGEVNGISLMYKF